MRTKGFLNISKSNLFILLIMLIVSKSALSASAGLGVSLSNAQSFFGYDIITPTVLIPIEVTPHLIIEPFLSTSTYKDTGDFFTTKIKNNTFGLGIFGTHLLSDGVSNYYGMKVSKSMLEATFSDSVSSETDKYDYLTITPLVGFKYDATKAMSAAFELGVNYTTGDETDCCDSRLNSDIEDYSLYASLAMRYLFK